MCSIRTNNHLNRAVILFNYMIQKAVRSALSRPQQPTPETDILFFWFRYLLFNGLLISRFCVGTWHVAGALLQILATSTFLTQRR